MAKFRHDTSREQDPQLHTHCVVLNATQRRDGEWRSLSSEKLFDHKMMAGSLYRATLAYEIQKYGYTINKTHADGRFELKEVPKAVIDEFSTRRQQIAAEMAARGLSGDKMAEQITLQTRIRKIKMDRDSLRANWLSRTKTHAFDIQKTVTEAKEQSHSIKRAHASTLAVDAVRYACAHLAEREARFSHESLMRTALAHTVGDLLPQHIEKAIQQFQATGFLKQMAFDNRGFVVWTTREAIALEKENVRLMREEQASVNPLGTNESVSNFLSCKRLTMGQQQAAEMILTTKDKVVGIQGYAGTGKTTLLNSVREYLEPKGYTLRGLAPSASAAQQLEKEAGIKSSTVHRYLAEMEKLLNQNKIPASTLSREVIILDESSMTSTRHLHKLLLICQQTNTRLVLVGDKKQLGAVEAGKPFTQLQKAGMETAVMKDILRQKNPDLLSAIHQAIKGDIHAAIEKIGANVVSIADKNARLEKNSPTLFNINTTTTAKNISANPSQ